MTPTVINGAPAAPAATPAPASTPSPGEQSFISSLPTDWRDQIVKDMQLPEAQANQLGRFSAFPDLIKSYFSAQEMIRTGQAKQAPVLPPNATPEQVTEYRTKVGVPETVEGYKVTLDEGLVLSEEDNRILNEVFKVAHANFVKPEVVSQLTNAMLRGRLIEFNAVMAQHGVDQQTGVRVCRENWGSDYETNRNIIAGVLSRLPEGARQLFEGGTLADGKMILNSPEVLQFLCDIGRELNPLGTVVPSGGNPVQTVIDEIAKIEADMRSKDADELYWSKPDRQKRYEKLLQAKAEYDGSRKAAVRDD